MQTPSPSPSSPASLSESSSANGIPDHVTHLGSAEAWPSLSLSRSERSAFALALGRPLGYIASQQTSTRDESHPSCSPTLAPELHLYDGSLPDFERVIDGSGYSHGNEPVTPGTNGAVVTQVASPVQWNPLEIPIENAFHNIIDHQDNSTINGDISTSSVPETQTIPDTFPANIPNSVDAGIAMGYPNNWDGANMHLNTSLMNYHQSFIYGLPSMGAYPSFHPFNLGAPTLPTMQAPRAPTFCTLCSASFTRPSDFQRHHESVHLGIKHHCFWIGCSNNRGNGYCRAEKLRTHQRKVHGLA